jgi:hypothetical protein
MAQPSSVDATPSARPRFRRLERLVSLQAGLVERAYEEVDRAQARWVEQGNLQLDEVNDLMKSQFNAVNELAAAWRKLTLSAFRASVELLTRSP